LVVAVSFIQFLAACGGHKPAGTNPFPVHLSLNPATSTSMQLGSAVVFTAGAQNSENQTISPTFTYTSSNPGIVDISPLGFACAGTWNAPYYSVCTPGGLGAVEVTVSALGATSAPTLVFVHQPIDKIQVNVVPPVNSPPPACPTQVALPAACDLKFTPANPPNSCISTNQVLTLEALAYSQGTDITASVGPFTWSQVNPTVTKITPIITSTTIVGSQYFQVATNQATVEAGTPGATQVIASSSGFSSQPYIAETCPVQCIDLELGVNGSQSIGTTSFITNKSTSETITATAVDVQGCIVPQPPLSWTSSSPAALGAGSGTSASCTGATCAVSTTQPGSAAISAYCTPPNCNIGFPLNVPGVPALYLPEPVYSVTAISGLVTGTTNSTSVLASSQDCYSKATCSVALYDVPTTTNIVSGSTAMPTPPNSLLFDTAGDKAYAGSQYGAFLITSANLGSASSSPFTLLPAPSTTLGLVTGKVIGVSPNGSLAAFSDTISTPNQVYVVNGGAGTSTTPLNINSAIAATFSPDNSKAFILGDGGNTLYVYSTLQALQTFPLSAPADAVAFSSTGAYAFIAGGDAASNVTVRNTCDNSLAVSTPPGSGTFSITGLPATPRFLKMVPPGIVPGSSLIPALQQTGVSIDFFYGIDNSGIDIIATATTNPLLPQPATLCPQQTIALPTYVQNSVTNTFNPLYINLQKGTFHPINFFLSPDATQVYIVTSDLGVLVYSFSTQAVTAIPLTGGAAPVAADITVDGTLIYVAGSDGLLHQVNTPLALDEMEASFPQLGNSSNNFCYQNYSCTLNLVAVKP
jgi:hypothetical protein